jgi:hypothetical protein
MKKCAFCTRPADSREHIFSDWMLRIVPTKERFAFNERIVQSGEYTSYKGRKVKLKAKVFREAKRDRQKLEDACNAFNCDPWIAVYAECDTHADLFLTSLANYDKRYRVPRKAVDGWAMNQKSTNEYEADPEVKHISIDSKADNWWKDKARSAPRTNARSRPPVSTLSPSSSSRRGTWQRFSPARLACPPQLRPSTLPSPASH